MAKGLIEDSVLQDKRSKLLEIADDAITALHEVAQSADKDSSRVAAAAEILDRIGLVKPREAPQGIDLDPAVLIGTFAGLASVFGRGLSESARTGLRNVTKSAPAEAPVQPTKRSRRAPRAIASQKGEP